jgi:signal peptidase I
MSPLISAVLSFLMPGLGQYRNGQLLKGIIFYSLYLISIFLFYFLNLLKTFNGFIIVFVLAIAFYVFIIVDACLVAKRAHGKYPKLGKKWPIYAVLIILHLIFSSQYKRFINANFISAYKVPTSSMEPTLMAGDYLLADHRYYKSNPIKQNDVIVLRFQQDPKREFIKRCIAIGGQVVEIKNKKVSVDGKIFPDSLETKFIDRNIFSKEFIDPEIYPENMGNRDNYGPIIVPRDHCFVLGDNRDNTIDSRYRGFVPIKDVLGKPLYIYWAKDKTRIGRYID